MATSIEQAGSKALMELEQGPKDMISSVRFSPSGQKLVITAWDSVSIYHREGPSFVLYKRIDPGAPVLDFCFGSDDVRGYCCGLSTEVGILQSEGNPHELVLSTHGEASNKLAYSKEWDLLLSTSWEGTLHAHDCASRAYVRIKLAAKPYAISLTPERAVIAMADRKVSIYDLATLSALIASSGVHHPEKGELHDLIPWQQRESNLKFMTRDVACMPNGTGFATSSIEGRVSVEYFDPDRAKETYAFKCHRQTTTVPNEETGEDEEIDLVYPVNSIVFNPVHGTFATGGGDGVVTWWDAGTRRRIKQYSRLGAAVAGMDVSLDGKFLAIGISPGFEDEDYPAEDDEAVKAEEPADVKPVDPERVKVYVRELGENEAKLKAKEK